MQYNMSNQTTDLIIKDCPIRNVLAHVCSKWSLLVIYVMHKSGNIRFGALNKAIPDISQKVLTSTLRSLEADGFVKRQVYAEVPPRVEYTLTDLGQSMMPILDAMEQWGSAYKCNFEKN